MRGYLRKIQKTHESQWLRAFMLNNSHGSRCGGLFLCPDKALEEDRFAQLHIWLEGVCESSSGKWSDLRTGQQRTDERWWMLRIMQMTFMLGVLSQLWHYGSANASETRWSKLLSDLCSDWTKLVAGVDPIYRGLRRSNVRPISRVSGVAGVDTIYRGLRRVQWWRPVIFIPCCSCEPDL